MYTIWSVLFRIDETVLPLIWFTESLTPLGRIMSKYINLSIFLIIGFVCSQGHAQKTISLSPNETKLLTNNTLWKVNATCTIQGSPQTHSKIRISVLKNTGTINGKNVATGQATMVTVQNNSSISVSAESGAQINLINLGTEGLQAVCNT